MGRRTAISAAALGSVAVALIAFGAPGGTGSAGGAAEAAVALQDAGDGQATGYTAAEAITAHETATRGPEQPIPFSHRFHSTELRIDCMYCHAGTESSQTGIVPSLEVCMGCHRVAGGGLEAIEDLRGYWERGEPVPWRWVNKLAEFAQFNHAPHIRNGVECAECHGPVEEMDRVYQWAPLTMGWCLECHRQEPAETDVATDYALRQRFPPPPMPEGREPLGLYPVRIDTEYAVSRGPIDCAACHY